MFRKLQKKAEGFTIIEVLIVLAIAGLILLIVFLAVPALQRNSRNTQYRNEASQLLSAATEFSNNKGGATPAAADNTAILALTKNKNITSFSVETHSGTTAPDLKTAILRTGAKCGAQTAAGSNPTGNYTTTAGPTRALAIVYAIENSTGAVDAQCTES